MVKVATWNAACINTNPFEYYNKDYKKLFDLGESFVKGENSNTKLKDVIFKNIPEEIQDHFNSKDSEIDSDISKGEPNNPVIFQNLLDGTFKNYYAFYNKTGNERLIGKDERTIDGRPTILRNSLKTDVVFSNELYWKNLYESIINSPIENPLSKLHILLFELVTFYIITLDPEWKEIRNKLNMSDEDKYEKIYEYIKAVNADIMFLQELSPEIILKLTKLDKTTHDYYIAKYGGKDKQISAIRVPKKFIIENTRDGKI